MLVAGQHAVSPHLAQTLRLRGRARICARLFTSKQSTALWCREGISFGTTDSGILMMLNLLMQNSLPRQGLLNPISVAGTFVHTAPHALRVRVGFGVTSWRLVVMA